MPLSSSHLPSSLDTKDGPLSLNSRGRCRSLTWFKPDPRSATCNVSDTSVADSLVSSLLLSGATMSQQSSLMQSAHSVRQVLTAYSWRDTATWAVIEVKSREDECGTSANTKWLAAETPRKSSNWPPSGHIFISKLCGEFARKRGRAWHSAYAMFGAIRLLTALSMSSCTTIP